MFEMFWKISVQKGKKADICRQFVNGDAKVLDHILSIAKVLTLQENSFQNVDQIQKLQICYF